VKAGQLQSFLAALEVIRISERALLSKPPYFRNDPCPFIMTVATLGSAVLHT
jgi:hypothetical protein